MTQHTTKAPRTHWNVECRDKDGNLKWVEDFDNLITDAGVNNLLDIYFKATAHTAAWYIGLIGDPATLATTDTIASHAGWTEYVDYTAVGRPALALGPTGNKTANNSATRAQFTLAIGGTLAGVFLINSSLKGFTDGTIYSEALFLSGNKILAATDTLGVVCTVSGE